MDNQTLESITMTTEQLIRRLENLPSESVVVMRTNDEGEQVFHLPEFNLVQVPAVVFMPIEEKDEKEDHDAGWK